MIETMMIEVMMIEAMIIEALMDMEEDLEQESEEKEA